MLSIKKINHRELKQPVGKLVKPLWEINKCPISDEPDKDDPNNDPTVVLIHRATCIEIKNYQERFKYTRKRVDDDEDEEYENISKKNHIINNQIINHH